MKTHYEILNVSSNATIEEIKKAYREIANVVHPDKNDEKHAKTATDQFKLVEEAYRILCNEKLRIEYDLKIAAQLNTKNISNNLNDTTNINLLGENMTWGDFKVLAVLLFIGIFILGLMLGTDRRTFA